MYASIILNSLIRGASGYSSLFCHSVSHSFIHCATVSLDWLIFYPTFIVTLQFSYEQTCHRVLAKSFEIISNKGLTWEKKLVKALKLRPSYLYYTRGLGEAII